MVMLMKLRGHDGFRSRAFVEVRRFFLCIGRNFCSQRTAAGLLYIFSYITVDEWQEVPDLV